MAVILMEAATFAYVCVSQSRCLSQCREEVSMQSFLKKSASVCITRRVVWESGWPYFSWLCEWWRWRSIISRLGLLGGYLGLDLVSEFSQFLKLHELDGSPPQLVELGCRSLPKAISKRSEM